MTKTAKAAKSASTAGTATTASATTTATPTATTNGITSIRRVTSGTRLARVARVATTGHRIAALEGDSAHAELIRGIVTGAGHECVTFLDGRRLLLALRKITFDLLLLDWHATRVTGMEIVVWVRAHLDPRIPVIFLARRGSEDDIAVALAAGADDYLIKPIRPAELAARMHALLRRVYPGARQSEEEHLSFGRYGFDLEARQATRDGVAVALTPKEFNVAVLMFRNAGRVVTREHLVMAVWGRDLPAMSRTIDTHISRMRSKLGLREEEGARVMPVYTYGYRLELLDDGVPRQAVAKRKKGTRRCLSAKQCN